MKKIIITCKDGHRDRGSWEEEYQIEDNQNAEEYAKDLIKEFNDTLRPGESPRSVVNVKEEELGPILTGEEFLEEAFKFKIWTMREIDASRLAGEMGDFIAERMIGVLEEIWEEMIQTGEVERFKKLLADSITPEPVPELEKFQRLVESPLKSLRVDITIEDLKEEIEENEKDAPDAFKNIHPMGIVKGGLSIGVYADPMSFASSQEKDFKALEKDIAKGMGEHKYYTTRLQAPDEALDKQFDLLVLDYGGMTIPGMSGMAGSLAHTVRKILDEKPSTMIWLASTFTANGYMDLVEEEYGEKHPNLIIKDIQKEKSWEQLHKLWENK